jgi:hypothetical protein
VKVETRLSTQETCQLKLSELKELISACHLHGIKDTANIHVEMTGRAGAPDSPYFSLVVTAVVADPDAGLPTPPRQRR